jgi:hypothetical protein
MCQYGLWERVSISSVNALNWTQWPVVTAQINLKRLNAWISGISGKVFADEIYDTVKFCWYFFSTAASNH